MTRLEDFELAPRGELARLRRELAERDAALAVARADFERIAAMGTTGDIRNVHAAVCDALAKLKAAL